MKRITAQRVVRRRNHCGVVGTQNIDSHRFGGSIRTDGVKTVGIGFTGHELIVRRVHGVSPLARGIHAELAITVVTGNSSLSDKRRCTVHISHRHLTGCSLHHIGLGQIGRADTAEYSKIIGTSDADGHQLRIAIRGFDREAVVVSAAKRKFIVGTIHGVSPLAVYIHAE